MSSLLLKHKLTLVSNLVQGDVIMGIQAQPNADLALEGNEMPRAKVNTREGNQGNRPIRQQGVKPVPHQGRPKYPNYSQQRSRDRSEWNPHQYQEYRYGDRNPKHGMHPGMEDLIRRCVAEAIRNLEVPVPPGSPKEPDTEPHRLD